MSNPPKKPPLPVSAKNEKIGVLMRAIYDDVQSGPPVPGRFQELLQELDGTKRPHSEREPKAPADKKPRKRRPKPPPREP